LTARTLAYFDTSVVAKRYIHEPGSQLASVLLRRHRLLSSAIVTVELHSVIYRSYRSGLLAPKAFQSIIRKIEADRVRWETVAVSADILAKSEDLVRDYDVRSLDAIHLASASLIYERIGRKLLFATADRKQFEAARQLNLNVTLVE
jgi:predicted nucleic acid-binding protein